MLTSFINNVLLYVPCHPTLTGTHFMPVFLFFLVAWFTSGWHVPPQQTLGHWIFLQHPVVARSFYQRIYHSVGLSSVSSLITTVKHQTCPLLRTPHRVKSSSFLWFSLLHITSPICKSAISPRPLPTTLGVAHRLLVYRQPMFTWRFAFIPWSFCGCSFVSLLLTLNVKSAGRLPRPPSLLQPLCHSLPFEPLQLSALHPSLLKICLHYWFIDFFLVCSYQKVNSMSVQTLYVLLLYITIMPRKMSQ